MSLFAARPDPERIARLAHLETLVAPGLAAEQTFAKAGQALAAIRDEKLYSHKWPSFPAYLEARWQIKERHAIRIIDAAAALKDLAELAHAAPTERHARILTHVPAEHRRDVAQEALSHAGQDGPTAPTLEQLEAAAAPFRRRRKVARKKQPRPIVFKGKGWTVTITRRREEVTAGECLELAAAMNREHSPATTKAA